MTEQDADAIRDTFDRDQDDAAVRDMTNQIARHFLTMKAAGMSEAAALVIVRDFQRYLMVGMDVEMVFAGAED